MPRGRLMTDLSNYVFGRLTVIAFADRRRSPRTGFTRVYWECRCICGNHVVVHSTHLVSGHTKSCGCLRANGLPRTHGQSKTPEHRIFFGIIQRCTNPHTKWYVNYGGRGIRCEWPSFETFYADMGPRPSPRHSIDRKDNNGNYSKANCRWATPLEQARNSRHCHMLTFRGITQPLSVWAEQVGMLAGTLYYRIRKGWPPEKALIVPAKRGIGLRLDNL